MTGKEHDGRVALFFGGTSGIGRATALELARQGAKVAVHGLDASDAVETAATIRRDGGEAIAVHGSVDDEATSERAVAETIAAFGWLDTMVASAGMQRCGDVVSTSRAEWDEVFGVNVSGAFLSAHHSLPHIRTSPNGNVVSVAVVQASPSQTQVRAYSASKGALVSLARAMAVDDAVYGVRADGVSSGSVDTPMFRASAAKFRDGSTEDSERILANWRTSHALGCVATPDEVAAVISFLTSPRAFFVTGIDLKVDGGLLAQLPVPIAETK